MRIYNNIITKTSIENDRKILKLICSYDDDENGNTANEIARINFQ